MPKPPFPALMFAAGFGTRMKHLTKDQPKPMIPVAGRPLIDHTLDLVRGAGCRPVAANLHYKPQVLQNHLADRDVICIVEHPQILETGGGLRGALPHLGAGPVITLNTDAIWAGPNPLPLLIDAWNPDGMDALLMTVPLAHAKGHSGQGDFARDAAGRLTRGPGAVYGGVQIIKTDALAHVTEDAFSLNVLWDKMLAQGRVFGLTYPGKWCDVGHPDGITLAEQMLDAPDV